MPSENVEIVRRAHEAWARGDFSPIDIFDPDVEFETVRGIGHGIYHGLGEMAQAWREILSSFGEFRTEVEEIIDAGDRIVVLTVPVMRIKGATTEVTQRTAVVWTLRSGRVVRLALHGNRDEALEEAGLR